MLECLTKVCQRFGEGHGNRPYRHRRSGAGRRCSPTSATSRPPTEWDPGTLRTTRDTGTGGVGTRYHNVSRFLGRETELTYEVDRVHRHRPLAASRRERHGLSRTATTLTPPRSPAARTELTYRARFTFKGVARLVAPLPGPSTARVTGPRRLCAALGCAAPRLHKPCTRSSGRRSSSE